MKRALLIAGGEVTASEFQKIKNSRFDVVVAADGGAANALSGGYRPDYVVGDLDSITAEVRQQLPSTQFVRRPSVERNDLEKALRYCESLDVTDITLLGITGHRLDHTLSNLSVLCRYDLIFRLTIYDAHSQIFIARREWTYRGKPGQLISVLPAGLTEGVSTEGLAYPLNDETLEFGKREGLSNFVVSGTVRVKMRRGLLFIFVIDPVKAVP